MLRRGECHVHHLYGSNKQRIGQSRWNHFHHLANGDACLTSDTSTIVNNGGGFYTDTGTATVSVSGGGSDTFTDTMRAFVLQGGPTAGILDGTEHLDVLDVNNAGFATYALNTSIGPLSGGTTGNSGDTYATTGGTFGFTSPLDVDHTASFTAATSSAPEPGTLGLIGASIGFLLLRRARS